jgi:hypothetical protein
MLPAITSASGLREPANSQASEFLPWKEMRVSLHRTCTTTWFLALNAVQLFHSDTSPVDAPPFLRVTRGRMRLAVENHRLRLQRSRLD